MSKTIKEMREFLHNHERYYTMNSCNGLHSFAQNVKLQRIKAPNEAYDFLECQEAFDDVNFILDDFRDRHNGDYCIIQNGRSGGYLVLCRGQYEDSWYKSYCTSCGQKNHETVPPELKVGKCGACGKMERRNFMHPQRVHKINSRSIGQDLENMTNSEIRELYRIVRDFDNTVKACCDSFLEYVKNHTMKDQTIFVAKHIKVQ